MKDLGTRLAEPKKPLQSRQLNDLLNAVKEREATPAKPCECDPSEGFYAEITAVGGSGWHSWKRKLWNTATTTFIDYPVLGMTGNYATNGAYETLGQSATVGDVVYLRPLGPRSASSQIWPTYSFTKGGATFNGAGTVGQIGSTCFGVYGGTVGSTAGGSYGYGYTNCTVTIPDPVTPGSTTTETWRLQHLNSVPLWGAQDFGGTWGVPVINGYSIPNSFWGVRGALVSAGVYNCLQYSITTPIFYSSSILYTTIFNLPTFQDFAGKVWRAVGVTPYRPIAETTGNIGASNSVGAQLSLMTKNGWYLNKSVCVGYVQFSQLLGYTIVNQSLWGNAVNGSNGFATLPSDVSAP